MSLRKKIIEAGNFVNYLYFKFLLGPGFFLTGYRRTKVGKCVIAAPLNKIPLILQGFAYLKTIDQKMYQRLTIENQFIFYYVKKLPLSHKRQIRVQNIYTITDSYLSWGNEGVVVCLVQSVLRNAFPTNFVKGGGEHFAASRELKQQIFEWVKNHSFPSAIVEHYKTALEK
jgi:hypothetical protein